MPRLQRFETQVFEEDKAKIIASMVPTPFGFFEMKQEKLLSHARQFGGAELGEAPEALNAVDVILATRKLLPWRSPPHAF